MARPQILNMARLALKETWFYVRSLFSGLERPSKPTTDTTKEKPLENPRNAPISRLPVELVLEIARYLSPSSKGCLALTCKTLCAWLLEYQNMVIRHFPKAGMENIVSPVNRERVRFLLRLETPGPRGWKYCAKCLKLHRRDEFKDGNSPTTLACKWPGIIRICECIHFTPRGIVKLAHKLQATRDAITGDTRIMKTISNWHQCRWKSPELRGVVQRTDLWMLSISLALDEEGCVLFRFKYFIRVRQPQTFVSEKITLDSHSCVCGGQAVPKKVTACPSFSCGMCRVRQPGYSGPCKPCSLVSNLVVAACWNCYLDPVIHAWESGGWNYCFIEVATMHVVPNMDLPPAQERKIVLK